MEIVGTRGQILMAKCTKIDFSCGSAPDPAGGAYDAPLDPLVGWGDTPSPYPTALGAYSGSTLAPSALVSAPAAPRPLGASLRRSAASQRLKPTLLFPSGAATEHRVSY